MKILFGQMWTIRGQTSTDCIFFFFLRVNLHLETPVSRTDWCNYYQVFASIRYCNSCYLFEHIFRILTL